MQIQVSDTFYGRIYMAGNFDRAKNICLEYCFSKGLCVNIFPSSYLYTGGEESGFIVELINYPRFPSDNNEIVETSKELANLLMMGLFQKSYTIMFPNDTFYYSRTDKIRR